MYYCIKMAKEENEDDPHDELTVMVKVIQVKENAANTVYN